MNVALIVLDAGSPNAADARMYTALGSAGSGSHTVTYVTTDDLDSAGASYLSGLGYDMAAFGNSWANGTPDGTAITAQDVPFLSFGLRPDLLGLSDADSTAIFNNDVDVTDDTDAVAVKGGWSSGTQGWTLYQQRYALTTNLGSGASVFGIEPSQATHALFFRYDMGDALISGSGNAAELRLSCGLYSYDSADTEEPGILDAFIGAIEDYLSPSGAPRAPAIFELAVG